MTITPATPFELTAEPTALTLRFTALLPYATRYVVSVPAHSIASGADATVTYSFRTPDPVTYLLRRGQADPSGGTSDEIVRSALGADEQVVVRARRIQEYAVSAGTLALVTQNEDGIGTLTVRPANGTGAVRTVAENGFISQLQAASPSGLFGFVLLPTSGRGSAQAQLKIVDPANPTALPGELGFDRLPLEPQTWAFVPGTSSIVAQAEDAVFYLIDPYGRSATRPLGAHLVLHGFIHNSTTALFEDPGHYTTINLSTAKTQRLEPFGLSKTARLSELFPTPGDDEYVGLEVTFDQNQDLHYRTVAVRRGTISPLYTVDTANTWIPKICLSPNGEYVAVQTAATDAKSDERAGVPGYVGTQTAFVDTATGDVARTVSGFAANWCN